LYFIKPWIPPIGWQKSWALMAFQKEPSFFVKSRQLEGADRFVEREIKHGNDPTERRKLETGGEVDF